MTEVRYGDLVVETGVATVTSIGSQPGPAGGDGWTRIATLPHGQLPSGSATRLALIVNGKIGGISTSGTGQRFGIVQVCLGDTGGLKSPYYRQQLCVTEALPNVEAVPFQFMVLFSASPSISDPLWGATWNNSSGNEFCLWARTYRNGDPATYACSFLVGDVSWLWWDTNAIPSTDQLCDQYSPATPTALTTTPTLLWMGSNSPGSAADQKWLHFFNVVYQPRVRNCLAPSFQLGHGDAGGAGSFVAKIGTGAARTWGMARMTGEIGGTEQTYLHHGAFWYQVQPTSVWLPAVKASDRPALAGNTVVHRVRYFGVRLDSLADVLVRVESSVANSTGNLTTPPNWLDVWIALERQRTGVSTLPMVLCHGIPQVTGRRAYGAALRTDTGRQLAFPQLLEQTDDQNWNEATGRMAFSRSGFSPNLPDIQYRAHFVGGLSAATPTSYEVRDLTILQVYPVKEPDVIPNVPPTPTGPVLLVPGRESADPSSLSDPPIAPNAATDEGMSALGTEIEGGTGYSRTWPLFAKVRRGFALLWDPIKHSDTLTLTAFLQSNPVFRITPPRESAKVAVAQIEKAAVEPSGINFRVSVRVAELIWTG